MDSSLLTSFRSGTIPTYADLFKVKHSDNQALLLFVDYLCYRALQDVLSLRTSRWEHLVHTLYQYIKDVADDECKRWLCCVNLAIHVRDGISTANGKNYARVCKCFIANLDLFQAQFHKKTVDELNVAIGCYLLLIEEDKEKASEICGTHPKVQELISAFPDFTEEQNDFMAGKNPHFVLIKILDQLRCVVMKMQSPVLTEIFDEYQCAVEEQRSVAMEKETSKSKVVKKASDTVASSNTIISTTSDEPGTTMEVNSPRRSSRSTLSKYKSKSPLRGTSSSIKPMSSSSTSMAICVSTSMAVCVAPDNPTDTDNISTAAVDTTPRKSTPAKPVKIDVDSDTEISPKKSKIAARIMDNEEQQPSSTVRNGDSPAAPKHYKGRLRDLKIVGEVSNEWSSDESDEVPTLVHSKEIRHRKRQSLELPKRLRYKAPSGSRRFWTEAEEKNLLKGVETFGIGQWSNILKSFYFAPHRDNVSLKDKWRNMVKNRMVPKKYL